MKAKDVMTVDVLTVTEDTSVLEAIRLMLQRRISGLPVVNASDAVVGMVTEGDLLRRVELGTERRRARWIEFLTGPGRQADEYTRAHGRKVGDVMTREVHTVPEDATLTDALDIMERYRVRRVPVMRDRKMIGIVTRSNLLRAIAGLARATTPVSADDATIRENLLAELKKQRWAPTASIDVEVSNGVVIFSGAILDDRQRDALRVAAENIPGVKRIEDRLAWIEPMSGTVITTPTGH
jgi:CBS domain-containing protein